MSFETSAIAYIFCFLLCFVSMIYAKGSVSIVFDSDQLTIDKIHQFIIQLDAVQLDGLTVSPSQADHQLTDQSTTWQFYQDYDVWEVSHYNTTSGGNIVYCLDLDNKQFWTYLQFDETSFTLRVVDNDCFTSMSPPQRTKFTFHCPVRVLNNIIPTSTMMDITYTPLDSIIPITIQQLLSPSKPEFLEPILSINSLIPLSHSNHPTPFSGASIVISFSTNNFGPHTLTIENGPKFYPASYTYGTAAPFYCSSTDSDIIFFQRIQYVDSQRVRVYIDQTDPSISSKMINVKCDLFLRNEFSSITDPSTEAKIYLQYGAKIVMNRINLQQWPANYRVDASSVSRTHLTLKVTAATSSQYSTTPINENSIVSYRFSSHIDISTLEVDSRSKQPRSFECASFVGTLYLNMTANSIDIYDILPTTDEEAIVTSTCTFSFSTTHKDDSEVFDFSSGGTGTVSVYIDWIKLYGHYGHGLKNKYDEPYYIGTQFNLTKPTITRTQNNDLFVYNYQFELSDRYNSVPVSSRLPKLIIGLDGKHDFNYQTFSSQLNCTWGSSSTTLSPLKLQFDAEHLVWVADLTSIRTKPRFFRQFVCSRRTPVMVKYGFVINPLLNFVVQVIDLLDNHRYVHGDYTSPSYSVSESIIPQEMINPGSQNYPQNPVQYICASGSIDVQNIQDVQTLQVQAKLSPLLLSVLKTAATTTSSAAAFDTLAPLENILGNSRSALEGSYKVLFHNAKNVHEWMYDQLDYSYVLPEISAAPLPYTAMFESDPLQSSLLTTTMAYSKMCFYTTQPFNVIDDDGAKLVDEFIKIKKESQLQLFHLFLNQNGTTDYTSTVVYLDTPAPRLDLPLFQYKTVVDKQTIPTVYNKITKCGWIEGLMVSTTVDNITQQFVPFTWESYSLNFNPQRADRMLCPIGHKCTINADCDTNDGAVHCSRGVCSFISLKVPNYVDYRTARTEYSKQMYFDTDHELIWLLYVLGVVALVITASFFTGIFLCSRANKKKKNQVEIGVAQDQEVLSEAQIYDGYPLPDNNDPTSSQTNSRSGSLKQPLLSANNNSSIE